MKRLWLTKDPIQYQEWADLMNMAGLALDMQVDWTVGIYENQQLIASGSLDYNIIKCIAVTADYQSENVLSKLLAALKEPLRERQQSHIFLYTKPELRPIFQSLGFAEIARTQTVIFMEQGFPDIRAYQKFLKAATRPTQGNAAIVMNANPFTNGHLYLVTAAAKQLATVYVFVVSEDRSLFDAATRIRLVKAGVAHLANVVVLPTGEYLVSKATFPTYFLKDQAPEAVANVQATLDATLFKEKIAGICRITTRYVGEEPLSKVTEIYNQALKAVLEPELSLIVLPRKKVQGEVISASRVRKLIENKQYEALWPLVPLTTYQEITNQKTK
ncbi:[citrate (pro-3S)-lyase] ligase [Enterococcus faecalis]